MKTHGHSKRGRLMLLTVRCSAKPEDNSDNNYSFDDFLFSLPQLPRVTLLITVPITALHFRMCCSVGWFMQNLSENCKPSAKCKTAIQGKLYSKNPNMELDSFLNHLHYPWLSWTLKMKITISSEPWTLFSSLTTLLSFQYFRTLLSVQPRSTFCIRCAATPASSSESDSLWDVELWGAELHGEEHSGEHK